MDIVIVKMGAVVMNNNTDIWNSVYKRNKELDDIFFSKYTDENKMFEKNCIEFLVELGEFVNETKCFKYWTVKKSNYDKILEELADTFTILMYFYNVLNIDISYSNLNESRDILEVINETYYFGTKLYKKLDKLLLQNIFANLLIISKILNISEEEIIGAITKKQNIIEERLNSDY